MLVRIGSDDPKQIAEVRDAAPKILGIGAQPTSTPKQAPRGGVVCDERGYLEGRDPRTMSQDELRAMGTYRCRRTRRSGRIASIAAPARRRRSPSAWRSAARAGRSEWGRARGANRLPANSERRCGKAVAVWRRHKKVYPWTPKTMGRVPLPPPESKLSKPAENSPMTENSMVSGRDAPSSIPNLLVVCFADPRIGLPGRRAGVGPDPLLRS